MSVAIDESDKGPENSGNLSEIDQDSPARQTLSLENPNGNERTGTQLGLVWLYDADPLKDELCAWIWQDFSNSVYSNVAISVFLALLVNSYATTAAWEASGENKPPTCSSLEDQSSQSCIMCKGGEGSVVCTGAGTGSETCVSLNVPSIGGINATSFTFFMVGMSCISQLLVFVLMGESGDYSNNRKTHLLASSTFGALCLIAFAVFPIGEAQWKHVVAALLLILSNTAFGLAQIYYNAYLPLMAEDLEKRQGGKVSVDDVSNVISSYAMAAGYIGGISGLIVSIIILSGLGLTSGGVSEYALASGFRWCVVLAGVWWLVGNFLTIPRFQDRPGKEGSPEWYHSAHQFYQTITWTYSNLPITFRYLCLYFCYSDGFSTIASVALIYARLEMCASVVDLFIMAIESPICATIGNIAFLHLARRFKLSNRDVVVLVLCIISVIPIWGLIGYASDEIGLRNMWEAYIFVAFFGFCVGAIQSFTRTMFCELIPSSREAEYFSFYELTDKGSSWLGPLVVAALAAGDGGGLRLSFVYILFATLVPAAFLYNLDMEKGIKDANSVQTDDEAVAVESTSSASGNGKKSVSSKTPRESKAGAFLLP